MNKIVDKEYLLNAPEEEYMNDEQLDFFKTLLTDLKKIPCCT